MKSVAKLVWSSTKLSLCLIIFGRLAIPAYSSDEHLRSAIEDALGVSKFGTKIIEKAFFSPSETAPDIMTLRSELQRTGDMRNLTVGILLLPGIGDLQVTNLVEHLDRSALGSVFKKNETDNDTSLVRPQNITSIIAENTRGGKTTGSFCWSIPGMLGGTCKFILGAQGLEYLGIPKKKPINIYDGFTIFSEYGDFVDSHEAIKTVYYVSVSPISKDIEQLSVFKQYRKLIMQLNTLDLENTSVFRVGDSNVSFVIFSSYKQDQEKVLDVFGTSKRWSILLTGHAIGTPDNLPEDAIRNQLIHGLSGSEYQEKCKPKF